MSFKKNFVWGVSTSSYQIEGAWNEDGRTESVWDNYSHLGVCSGHNGDVACDHYHRMEEDVALMAELGVNAYRFSISWNRILPEGIGRVNEKGIAFYSKLVDCLLSHGITPYATLFHWDYPMALEKLGGWQNPESPKWFEEYTEAVVRALGDRVKNFFTFNEPQCFLGFGYRWGSHAPGYQYSDAVTLPMSHHILCAHGRAVNKIKELYPDIKVSYAPCGSAGMPATESEADIAAAKEGYFSIAPSNWSWSIVFWSDPVLLGHYPEDDEEFKKCAKFLPKGYEKDLPLISTPIDYYGQNVYNGAIWRAGANGRPETVGREIGNPHSDLKWTIDPSSLYWVPRFLYERYKKPVMITENGTASNDMVFLDGKVHDPYRIDFTHRYLKNLKRAADEGIPVEGYMHWSILDNFEWREGYNARFGLVYVDFATGERIKKDSFEWYKSVIASNGENL